MLLFIPRSLCALKRVAANKVRSYAVYAIANLGPDARDAIPVLEAITDPDMQVHIRFGLQRIRGMEKK